MRVLRSLGIGLRLLAVAGLLVWLWLAIGFQLDGALIGAVRGGAVLVAIGLGWTAITRPRGPFWVGYGVALLPVLGWWSTIVPLQDRDWADDVEYGVTAEIGPERVTLRHVRDFDWTTDTTAAARWNDVTVDPDQITSLDVVLSTWGSPDIAHTLVSFGFADGQHIVFSGEIRKERGESFSTMGGFFRRYELVLIAAQERDIIRLRTDIWGEAVSLYPIALDADRRRALFLSFLALGNDLAETPRWYNTVTANCTTVPFRLVRSVSDRAVADLRVLLSGRLPGYLFDLGVLPPGTLADLQAKARLSPQGRPTDPRAFSHRLRAAWRD